MASKLLFGSLGGLSYFYRNSRTSTLSEMAEDNQSSHPRQAICILVTAANETAKGIVHFSQENLLSRTHITGAFSGLTPNHHHGFHIHQYGNLSNGCVTAGPHFNPFGQLHGGPESAMRHVGDLGNVASDANGDGKFDLLDHQVTLHGPNSIVGRACVLHRLTDDLGTADNEESKKTGNAGARIACGVIGLAHE